MSDYDEHGYAGDQDRDEPDQDAVKTQVKDPHLPEVGEVILHETFDHAGHRRRDQALVVVGHGDEYEHEDPKTHERSKRRRVHAVPIGWADEYDSLPDRHPVAAVKRGEHASLHHTEWRRRD
jgi:hypothetical protein